MTTLAVVDVETTGLNQYRSDRIVEIAVVLLAHGLGIVAEFNTLVNPERDIGPTTIHGLTASDVFNAPRFDQIAADLSDVLRGAFAIAGHNVRFDVSFLRSEYQRMGVAMPQCTVIDTRSLTGGGSLVSCCAEHGIEYDGRAHAALHDARATARLLDKILSKYPGILDGYKPFAAVEWPHLLINRASLFPREKLQNLQTQIPGYIQRLAECLSPESAGTSQSDGESEYRALLWRVLEDGRVPEAEGDSLVEVAIHCRLTFPQVEVIHLDYLTRLARAACADRVINDAERRELQLVAELLGFGRLSEMQFDELLQSCSCQSDTAPPVSTKTEWERNTVCFTGECQCSIGGTPITREIAERLAAEKGLIVMSSVTKKLNLLVVADPNSQSGKAKKAMQYGVRVIHEPIFWRTLGVVID